MCGIVAFVPASLAEGTPAAPRILEGLQRLEYRGYDSAGIATLAGGRLHCRRAEGKLAALAALLDTHPLPGVIGIGHTRWATHGKPCEMNAHPHLAGSVAVVHNGIIENHHDLRAHLETDGVVFESDTDTEVIAHLLSREVARGLSPEDATTAVLSRLEGAFSLALLFVGHDDLVIGARRGSPLVVGLGEDGARYLGSDALALAPWTERVMYLEEGDRVLLRPGSVTVHDGGGREVQRTVQTLALSAVTISKEPYKHFMLKEIHEQPAVVARTLDSLVTADGAIHLPHLPFTWEDLTSLSIVACGGAYHVARVAEYWFEQLAHLPVEVDIGSEFRYREPPLPKGGGLLVISQSGETADTLASLAEGQRRDQRTLAVVNVPHSSIARQAEAVIPTLAGPEIGVASTKAFMTQLAVLLVLAVAAGRARGVLDDDRARAIMRTLRGVPALISAALDQSAALETLAQKELRDVQHALFLGRGRLYPIALEGALKLKEISYIHAEGYAAGELKHGPIALIDQQMPVIVLAPSDETLAKTASNVQEVAARGGRLIVLTDRAGLARLGMEPSTSLVLPPCDPLVAPLVYTVPVQLLAYFAAIARGTDVDQPRNLAKSVTVE